MTDMTQWIVTFWVPVAAVIVAVAVFTWMVARRTPANATEAIGMALQAATVARELVMAAEQLANNGTLPREERFNWVYRQLEAKFPEMEAEDIVATVEAAVYWLKQMSKAPA